MSKKEKVTLKTALLRKLPAAQYVEIVENDRRIGFTYIDSEDLFIHFLSDYILNKTVINISEVSDISFKKDIWRIEVE